MDPTKIEDQETIEKINDAYRNLQDPNARSRDDSKRARDSSVLCRDPTSHFVLETARSDQTECQVCFRPFKLGRRQHHCRRCVCNQCRVESKPIPGLIFPMPVRHCTSCNENPPKLIKPVMDPVAKPPAGFEYSTKLGILVNVKTNSNGTPKRTWSRRTASPTRPPRKLQLHGHRVGPCRYPRLGESTSPKAPRYFPDKRTPRGEREKVLPTFLYGCMLHPLLRDADALKAFLALPTDQLLAASGAREGPDPYKGERPDQPPEGLEPVSCPASCCAEEQKKHDGAQKIRRDPAAFRFKALEASTESQTERMEREKERYEKQSSTTHILVVDVWKSSFQQDTTQWNNGMAQWSKHRADSSEAHNPDVSKDIANDYITLHSVQVENVYSVSKPLEKDEEMLLAS
ncbi:WD repeat and FYVE domain-containing protein 1 [Phytophthora pseudosyringae]|uniref:WD repeat and FYVE domain-containing protein 1 n=1 Tax=Phytophthora pseudosyringae TaxID=221518 RepID=A0A8T1W656_9STRA|nr:WD repeat and FYVE domain-containing protein 1 [Phytophthora pseudosyringae]